MASFDEVKLEDILHGSFATFNPNTGANKDADSLPTLIVYEEGSSTALTTTNTVTNITTGRYRWQVNVAAADGFEQGKFYEVWISATVTGTDTVTQVAPVTSFKATSSVVDDTYALANGAAGFVAIDTVVDAILVDTGTDIPALIAALNNLSAAQVNTEVDTAITDAGLATAANLATVAGYLDTEIADILADTNELQIDWANGGRLDAILDIIAEDTTTDIPALIAAEAIKTAAIKTKTDFLPSATAGAAGGVFIAGSNAATTTATWTVTGATIHTGNVSMAAGLTIAQSTLNEEALSIVGNGNGQGVLITGGATGDAMQIVAGTNGIGLIIQGNGTGDGVHIEAGATGEGMHVLGGVTSGSALKIEAQGTNDHGLELNGIGTGKGFYADAMTVVGALTVGTNLLPWNAAWDAEVQSEAADALTVYAPATPAQVNAEVLDVMNVDTFAELAGPPAATSSLRDKLTWLFMWARNKSTETATQRKLFADDTLTVVGTEGVTDDGTTFTKTEVS